MKKNAPAFSRNPLIEEDALLVDDLTRVHAFAAFLQDDAEHAGDGGPLEGEQLGRALAHQVLTEALQWLKNKAEQELDAERASLAAVK